MLYVCYLPDDALSRCLDAVNVLSSHVFPPLLEEEMGDLGALSPHLGVLSLLAD